MNNLYTELSDIYEGMYQTFINYEAEFNFYSKILQDFHCKSVVEIGCGTGHLAHPLVNQGFEYMGLDLSVDMLAIARRNYPQYHFLEADMRNFNLAKSLDAAIITGRTISYLITNEDVYNTFKTIHHNLNDSGILCFDCIDANAFIPAIQEGKKIIHQAMVKGRQFQRDSFWTINFNHSWTFNWLSVYYEKNETGESTKIGGDHSTIRAFTKDEITLFLTLAGFQIERIIPRLSYAFDTYVFIAKK